MYRIACYFMLYLSFEVYALADVFYFGFEVCHICSAGVFGFERELLFNIDYAWLELLLNGTYINPGTVTEYK